MTKSRRAITPKQRYIQDLMPKLDDGQMTYKRVNSRSPGFRSTILTDQILFDMQTDFSNSRSKMQL